MFPRKQPPAKPQALRIYEVIPLVGKTRRIAAHSMEPHNTEGDDALLFWLEEPGAAPALVATFRLSALAGVIIIA